jgi:antitoxin CptB
MLGHIASTPPLPRPLWLKRLRYRSWHRGCKETDLVLGRYCDAHVETLDDSALTLFEALLDEDDADIWAWLTDKTPCPKLEYAPLLSQLKTYSSAA